MYKIAMTTSIVLIVCVLAAGTVTPASARSCGDILAGQVYSCSGTLSPSGLETHFDLSFASWPTGRYVTESGSCDCRATGRPSDPNFGASKHFLCIFPTLDMALEGKAGAERIRKGFHINAAGSGAFECTRQP